MRVLHIRTSAFLGSPEKLILAQIKGQSSRVRSHVFVIADQTSPVFPTVLKREGIPHRVSSFSLLFPWVDFVRLVRFIRRQRFDVVVTHDYKANFFAWLASSFARFSHMAVFHGRTRHDLKSKLYEALDNWVLRRVSRVVAVSEATKKVIPVPASNIDVIPNAYSPSPSSSHKDWKKEFGLSTGDVLIVSAGRLSEEKNFAGLIEAFGRIANQVPRCLLAIAGDGPERGALQTLINRTGLQDRVRLLGFVNDMPSLYQSLDFFVLSSKWEGLPLVLLEAAACEKTSLSTDVGGVSEFIQDGKTGLLVPPNDQEALANKLLYLIKNKNQRQQMGQKAKAHLDQNFSADRYAKAYEDLYWRLTKQSILWVSWESHRRTRGISESLGLPLQEMVYAGPGWKRYPLLTFKTVVHLWRARPRVLIVQSPSIILAYVAACLKPFFGYQLVVDAHNEAVRPYIYQMQWYKHLVQFAHRKADLTIVTNEGLKDDIEKNRGQAFILPDRIPTLPVSTRKNNKKKKDRQIVFICTYAPDEPYQEVVEAARQLHPHIRITITGNTKKADPRVIQKAPANVRFTGFLSEEDFIELLNHSDAIMDLTAMDDCLVCGAYEAVAVEKPMITSDKTALKNYFRKGAVYANHTPAALAKAVEDVLANHHNLQSEVKGLKKDLIKDWDEKKNRLLNILVGGLN